MSGDDFRRNLAFMAGLVRQHRCADDVTNRINSRLASLQPLINNNMPAMGTMPVMNNSATLTATNTPGIYRGKINIEMAGEWQAQIAYEGSAGKGKFTLPVNVQ